MHTVVTHNLVTGASSIVANYYDTCILLLQNSPITEASHSVANCYDTCIKSLQIKSSCYKIFWRIGIFGLFCHNAVMISSANNSTMLLQNISPLMLL